MIQRVVITFMFSGVMSMFASCDDVAKWLENAYGSGCIRNDGPLLMVYQNNIDQSLFVHLLLVITDWKSLSRSLLQSLKCIVKETGFIIEVRLRACVDPLNCRKFKYQYQSVNGCILYPLTCTVICTHIL